MVILYVTSGCASCRKATQWFKERGIPFIERNLIKNKLTLLEFKEILQQTDNGTEDIISTNSKQFKQSINDIDQLQLEELFTIIQKNPRLLRTPIIHDGKRFMTGYNESQIRRFVPRTIRKLQLQEAQKI